MEDCAISLQAIAGHDPHDPGSVSLSVPDYLGDLRKGVKSLRIGVPRQFYETSPMLSKEAADCIDQTIRHLRDLGAIVFDVELPPLARFSATARIVLVAEAYALHRQRMIHFLDDYETMTASRMLTGAGVSSADYLSALRLRRELARAVDDVFGEADILLTASTLASAPRTDQALRSRDWPIQVSFANLTGHPAASVPTTLDCHGLPLSIQLVGRPFDEATLLRVAQTVEEAWDWPATCRTRPIAH